MPVAGALAKKCDYPLVIVQCAFRSKAADDPKRFHLLTTNLPVDKVMARHAMVPLIFIANRQR